MNSPLKRDEARMAAGSESRYQTDDNAKHSTDYVTPWHVVVDGERRGQLHGRYASRAGAAATVRQLRAHGFVAHVEGPA